MCEGSGLHLYMVGGCIRDALMEHGNAHYKDIDYAVEGGSAFALAKMVADRFDGHFVPLDESLDTARVVMKDGNFVDFAGCVGGRIESDVRRRDFTINALVWDPEKPDQVLDLVGGLADLKAKTIRSISQDNLIEDPLRILRAFRFATTLDAVIEPQTMQWLKAHAQKLSLVAAERINGELFLVFGARKCAQIAVEMGDIGLLEIIFPELIATRQVTANAFHHLGLFEHSVETLPQLEQKLASIPDWIDEQLQQELNAGVTRLAATRAACLLHDIGKPATWAITDEGRHTFYGHDRLGAEMAVPLSQRMKWSRNVERFVVKLIKWHLRPGALFHQGPPTDRAVRRFYRQVGPEVPELMLLAFADFGATRGPGLLGENRESLERSLEDLLAGYLTYLEESRSRERLLDGQAVMHLLQIKPGPIVGEILSALEEAQEFKEVLNRADAERFVVRHYAEKYSK